MNDKQPVYILPENVSRTLGKDAQRNNILAAKIVADILKTTLGPKGMDKMLVDSSGNIVITNDGVTILEEMELDHPAAKILVDVAKTQEAEVGDGTTTVALLAGKLLERAETLLDKKIHPTVIVEGYRKASRKAAEILPTLSKSFESRNILKSIAMTAMTGKGAEGSKESLSEILVKAVERVSPLLTDDSITIAKIKGEGNSELVEGIVLEKERAHNDMPRSIKQAKILLLDIPLEVRGPETDTKVSISTPEQLESFILAEERTVKKLTESIISSGAKVVFCQKGIDDIAQYHLAKSGIMAFRRVSKSDMEKIALASSGKIISYFEDIRNDILGYADTVEETSIGSEAFTFIKGCKNPRSVTIVLKGSSSHAVDEMERALKDGLGDVISAVKSNRVVAGGGAIEIELAKQLRSFSKTLGGKEQLAIEEFSNALDSIPEALAENAGLEPIEILTELRKSHEAGMSDYGLNLFNNKIENTFNAGIIEPLKIKTQAISAATEVAMMILRIDDVLVSDKLPEKKGYELE